MSRGAGSVDRPIRMLAPAFVAPAPSTNIAQISTSSKRLRERIVVVKSYTEDALRHRDVPQDMRLDALEDLVERLARNCQPVVL